MPEICKCTLCMKNTYITQSTTSQHLIGSQGVIKNANSFYKRWLQLMENEQTTTVFKETNCSNLRLTIQMYTNPAISSLNVEYFETST